MSITWAAVLGAGARLRPIIMTSLAMIVGLLPLMFAMGVGANGNRSPRRSCSWWYAYWCYLPDFRSTFSLCYIRISSGKKLNLWFGKILITAMPAEILHNIP